MWKWFATNWGERKVHDMSNLAHTVGQIVPDWKQIQIDRNADGVLVLSIVGETRTSVERFLVWK